MGSSSRTLRPYAAAVAALLLVVGVAFIGASEPRPAQPVATSGGRQAPGGFTGPGALDPGDLSQSASADDGTGASVAGARSTRGSGRSGGGQTATAGAASRAKTARNYPQGVTDTSIKIGGSTFTSGPAAVYGEQIAVGFAAGVKYINDHGGINGRRVELVLYDDGADPAKQLTNVKRLVEVDKVFALAMAYAPIAGEYVAEKGIPVFHLGQFDEEFTNPWWFPVGGPQRLAAYATSWFGAKELGVKKAAIFYLDVGAANYSRQYAEDAAGDWKAYGVDVPVLVPFAPDQTSCSDALGQAREAEVDFIHFEIDASKVINCGVEAQLQGYKPPKGWGGYLIGVPVIHEALGDYSIGMYAFDAFGANYDVPDYKRYVREVSSSTESYSSVTASYFISALLMRDAIGALGDNITREGVRNVLNTFTNWRPGLTDHPNQPSWTWTPDCHVALKGGYVIQIQKQENGKLRWTQITPQFETSPLPPGVDPPARYAKCDVFRRETR